VRRQCASILTTKYIVINKKEIFVSSSRKYSIPPFLDINKTQNKTKYHSLGYISK